MNGILCPSFQIACIEKGLLEHDGEWINCLEEAAHMQSGRQLRSLFVTILMMGHPSDPTGLWMQFRANICDDLRNTLSHRGLPDLGDEQVYDYGLHLLEKMLISQNSSLQNKGMPESVDEWGQLFGEVNSLIAEQQAYDNEIEGQKAAEMLQRLNVKQRDAFLRIVHAVEHKTGISFFLNGSGGTGKTHLYQLLCHYFRSKKCIVLCVASTGIASLLLEGGRTAHSRFRIPLDINDNSVCGITKNSKMADLIRLTDLVIFDEVPGMHVHCIDAIERMFRDVIGKKNVPFGGVPFLNGGDFKQILPVIVKGNRADTVGACMQRATWWKHLEILHLTQNMRVGEEQEEREFANWQQEVGEGKHTNNEGDISIPPKFHCTQNTVECLIATIYPNLHNLLPAQGTNDRFFSERIILSARNSEVDELNLLMLNDFPGQIREYYSADTVADFEDGDNDMYPAEYLNSIDISGLPLATLKLKVGVPVMVMRNLAPSDGVCNGTRGIVTQLSNTVVEIRLIGGSHGGEKFFVPRIKMDSTKPDIPFTLRRLQFPLRLAFAMSINKSQGQSVKHVGLDLRSPVFTHGQFYVGISRATSCNR